MKTNQKKENYQKSPIEIEKDIEIEIDENGDLLLSRDYDIYMELAKELGESSSLKEFREFFDSKPKDIFGRKEYQSFCG